ncbi:VPS33 [Scenedesmus sp. PABB004]|nr:VPS33 [Scenedesmus sp. PABB004]
MAAPGGKAKAVLPQLEAGPVPLAGIRAAAKKQLVDIIDSKRGKKALILDPAISGSLTLLDAGLSELFSEHGVVKLLYLERTRLDDSSYNAAEPRLGDVRPLIYIARATLENAQLIAWQVKTANAAAAAAAGGGSRGRSTGGGGGAGTGGGGGGHEFSVFWVPRRSIAVERVLEDEGVYGDITQGEYPLDLVPLDDDVLSLELDGAFRECTLDGDPSSLFHTATALLKLQQAFGLIPRLQACRRRALAAPRPRCLRGARRRDVTRLPAAAAPAAQGKGPAATAVRDILVKLRRESPLPPAAAAACRIHRAVLIDREVDPVTPLLTQITFEGLIDEVTGIRHGSAPVTPGRRDGGGAGGGGGAAARPAATLLNSSDPFYKEFRDLPYYITSQRLQAYARDARREYAELGSKDLSGLKTFVKGLPKLLLLDRLSDLAAPVAAVVKEQAFHDRLKTESDTLEGYDAEESVAFITGLMWRRADPVVVLRLLCLLSCTGGGLPKKHGDALRSEFLSAYGHQHLLTLNNLERAGLLKPAGGGGRGHWASLRKALRLVVADPEGAALAAGSPTDVSQLYKGYAPVSVRLVQAALSGGWAPVGEALSLLPGGQFDALQVLEPSGLVTDRPCKASAAAAGAGGAGGEPETVLVVMLGGITFTEISALRFLASQPEVNARFLVLTTRVVSGRSLVESFIDAPARSVRAAAPTKQRGQPVARAARGIGTPALAPAAPSPGPSRARVMSHTAARRAMRASALVLVCFAAAAARAAAQQAGPAARAGGAGWGMMGGTGGGMMGGSGGMMGGSGMAAMQPAVARLIQTHVAQMHELLEGCRAGAATCARLRFWDPLFAAVYANAGSISMQARRRRGGARGMGTGRRGRPSRAPLTQAHAPRCATARVGQVTDTVQGVKVTETGATAYAKQLVKAHAGVRPAPAAAAGAGAAGGAMFEARLGQGILLVKLVDAIKDLVTDANFEATSEGISLQAMDTSHVCLVALSLRADGFDHYRCDRAITLGINLTNLAKLLKCAGKDDTIALKADDQPDMLSLMFEDPKQDRVADFALKLMDIEGEHLGIPETDYSATVRMPGGEYARIVKDLASIGDSVVVAAAKDGVKFSTAGDVGTANITIRNSSAADLKPEQQTTVELQEAVSLSFALRYLNSFSKAAPLSSQVRLSMSKDLPIVVEWTIGDMGHLKFYLAPKIDEDEDEALGDAPQDD